MPGRLSFAVFYPGMHRSVEQNKRLCSSKSRDASAVTDYLFLVSWRRHIEYAGCLVEVRIL
jgi:hypothetical protein